MTHRITLIPGDGIGPEVVEAARRAVEATGVAVEWDRQEMGAGIFARIGDPLPASTLASIRTNGVALKGPVETPVTSGMRSVNLALRRELDLFACIRPCRLYAGVPASYDAVDLIVVRENIEDMYTGIEFEEGTPATSELIRFVSETSGTEMRADTGISVKTISEHGSERIVRFAFDLAIDRGRTKVTAGHKANIMKFTDGLFLDVARRVAAEYPQVAFDDRIIDALCMQLVQAPERFDVHRPSELLRRCRVRRGGRVDRRTGRRAGGSCRGDGGRVRSHPRDGAAVGGEEPSEPGRRHAVGGHDAPSHR